MNGYAVLAAYHELCKVEQSFRMAKSALKAWPVHRTHASFEANLTGVFDRATSRHLQQQIGRTITRIVQVLQPLRAVVAVAHEVLAIDDAARDLIHADKAGPYTLWPKVRRSRSAT